MENLPVYIISCIKFSQHKQVSEINAIIQGFKKQDLIIKIRSFFKQCLHIRFKKKLLIEIAFYVL